MQDQPRALREFPSQQESCVPNLITPDGDLFKAGVGGQGLWVSPSHDSVVVFFSTGTQEDETLGAWVGRHITETFGRA